MSLHSVSTKARHSAFEAAGKAVPEGWSVAHPAASKAECLAFVETEWRDMRPASLGPGR